MSEEIINKVAQSGLTTLDLESFYPEKGIQEFDLKPLLFMEMIIREKDFREQLSKTDWPQYQGLVMTVTCSADAIIPMWAYMLVASYLQPYAAAVYFGTKEEAIQQHLLQQIRGLNALEFAEKRVVVKGCGDKNVGPAAYLEITNKLRSVARSIMYGEPCSTVPIFKRK
ncbi:MAG: DUF2480 family protein [Chitinophagaceae bacterium]|nr:MAG: DUF2480 family protein [Chitinophagaceae bacterium]